MEEFHQKKNYPSGIPGVPDFPGSICASINDEIIHGIPSKKVILKEGDVVSFDITAYKNGFHGDAARTYIVGKPKTVEDQKLVEVTKTSIFRRNEILLKKDLELEIFLMQYMNM